MKDAFTTILYDSEYRVVFVFPTFFSKREDAIAAGKDAVDGKEIIDYDVIDDIVPDEDPQPW